MRALIVDDERLARQEMRGLLESHPQIVIVGEAPSVAAARHLLTTERVEMIFLDVQLAGESGFDLMPAVGDRHVIFVTAFDNHAVRAFECAACDYLLKPVEPGRLDRALTRLRHRHQPQPHTESQRLTMDDWLFAPVGIEHGFISLAHIRCIVAEGDYSRVWFGDGRNSLMLRSLREWEDRLPESRYVRVHRSAIVNLEHVRRVTGTLRSGYCADVQGVPQPIPISRRYASRMRGRLR